MSGNDKSKAKASGWVIPGKPLFGNAHKQLRDEMKAAHVAWDSKDAVWICPTKELYDLFIAKCPAACAHPPVESSVLPPAPLPPPVVSAPTQVREFPVDGLPGGATFPAMPLPPTTVFAIVAPPPPSAKVEPPAPTMEQPKPVIQPVPVKAENGMALGFNTDRSVLRLEPSRYAIISVPIEPKGWSRPRRRRVLDRQIETFQADESGNSFETSPADLVAEANGGKKRGTAALKITTKAEQLIMNPTEHEEAKKLQSQLGYSLRRLGTRVTDGIIVFPLKNEEEFDAERVKCKQLAYVFNGTSTHYEIRIDAYKLEAVVSDEEMIARQVAYECQRLMSELRSAMDSLDVVRIREVASAAKYKASALAAGRAQGAMLAAVETARQAATKMAKDMAQKGADIEKIKRSIEFAPIDSARLTLLEYEIPEEVASGPGVDVSRFAELEDEPEQSEQPDSSSSSSVLAASSTDNRELEF